MFTKNNGVQTPATVSASFSITGPTGFTYSNSAPSTSIPSSGGIDSIDATTGITSGSTESGNYTATVSIDGGTDGAPSDNSTSLLFAGTANKYSWDNLPPSRIRRLEADDLLGIAYEAYSDDTIIGVELGIFDPASSSSVGTVMSVFIYKYSDIIESLDARINQGGGTFVNPVGTILSAYELTAADVNSYSEFKITNQIPMEAGETYVVAIKNLAGDQLWILFDPGVTASPWSVFETATTDFAGTGDTWFTENIVPHIRLLTKNSQVCDITTIDANGTVIPDYENFLVSIDLTPNGGSQPYVYSWSGPDGFSSEEQDLADLDVKGTYTVIIVDDNGCIGGASYVVDGNIGINDVANGAVVNVFPNPSNGSFNVSLDNVAGNYSINVSNSLGQVAASKNVSASGSNQIVEFSGLDLPVGVYTVSVVSTDDNSTLNVIKVVVE
ncbi:T9SS type A sorting domain-containing protein [Salibacteraceae bacterium]|nr:T9SS type A sorting domain-containing protein [Salibacteraceae bacterium]